jgi:hypothetical protein
MGVVFSPAAAAVTGIESDGDEEVRALPVLRVFSDAAFCSSHLVNLLTRRPSALLPRWRAGRGRAARDCAR